MTRVIQDAVKVAKALSIRYLWVDALCIIQGDSDDWARESEQMGLVYTNSYVTFCAISTSSCLEGFLDRVPPIRIGFQSMLRPDIRGTYNLRHQRLRSRFDGLVTFRRLDQKSGTWNDRAWTLQEAQLSVRQILFGPSRMHISCATQEVTEMLGKDSPYSPHFLRDLEEHPSSSDIEDLYDMWNVITKLYSRRKMTDKRDKLPALSGLTQVMAAKTGDHYLSGLWRNDLLRGLFWECESYGETWPSLLERLIPSPTTTYIGPSWSWCNHESISAQTFSADKDYPNREFPKTEGSFRSECKIIAASCTPESVELNPYGRIKDGVLHVEAKLVEIAIGRPFGDYLQWAMIYDGGTAVCEFDWSVDAGIHEVDLEGVYMLLLASSRGSNPNYAESEEFSDDSDLEGDVDHARDTPHDMHGDSEDGDSEEPDSPGDRNAWGLLVHPIANSDKYIRVGRFRCSSKQGGLPSWEQFPFQHVVVV